MKKQKIGYVYMITNPKGRIYIGSTVDFQKRMRTYKNYRTRDQPKIYNSLVKYGADNHLFEIIWEGSVLEMYKYETLIGIHLGALESHNLNLALPKLGDIYQCVSDEVRRKIGKAHKGKILSQETRNKIKKSKENVSIETRDKMSKSAKGKIITDKTKENMRLAQTGRKHSLTTRRKMSQWQIGKKLSQNTKDKISNKRTGIKHSKERIEKFSLSRMKPILQYTLNNVFVKEWISAKIAGEELSIDNSSITKCCKGVLKTSGKFKWKYKYEHKKV